MNPVFKAILFGVNYLPDETRKKTQLCAISNPTGEQIIEMCADLPVNDYDAFLVHDEETGRDFWFESPGTRRRKVL